VGRAGRRPKGEKNHTLRAHLQIPSSLDRSLYSIAMSAPLTLLISALALHSRHFKSSSLTAQTCTHTSKYHPAPASTIKITAPIFMSDFRQTLLKMHSLGIVFFLKSMVQLGNHVTYSESPQGVLSGGTQSCRLLNAIRYLRYLQNRVKKKKTG